MLYVDYLETGLTISLDEVIRILEKQAAVGAAEIFKRQLEEKLAADQAALERLMAK